MEAARHPSYGTGQETGQWAPTDGLTMGNLSREALTKLSYAWHVRRDGTKPRCCIRVKS